MAFHPNGKRVVTAGEDRVAKVWDTASGKELATLYDHASLISPRPFSPNGEWVVTMSDHRTASVWEVETGKWVATLEGHSASLTGASFAPDGRTLAVSSLAQTVHLLDLETGHERVLRGHRDQAYKITYSRDGRWIASGTWNGEIIIWDATTGGRRTTIRLHRVCGA